MPMLGVCFIANTNEDAPHLAGQVAITLGDSLTMASTVCRHIDTCYKMCRTGARNYLCVTNELEICAERYITSLCCVLQTSNATALLVSNDQVCCATAFMTLQCMVQLWLTRSKAVKGSLVQASKCLVKIPAATYCSPNGSLTDPKAQRVTDPRQLTKKQGYDHEEEALPGRLRSI